MTVLPYICILLHHKLFETLQQPIPAPNPEKKKKKKKKTQTAT